ncbi:DUF1178 family protein [Rhodospirillum centenum]|uniref:Uncharacterized protein n=1 Tax=Rhodospirillum centenum (strain ATCC 51521 / SW) TaxID=414684 RepID=B6IUU8_RHOCS|nr:DUF1178 family protein [Rhodospirillum centenum]ACJ00030.1 conserved hypothetical protein [Rhodospirillum centenum SW]
MILYQLQCSAGHSFDGWFRSGAVYDQQAAAGEISCPVCGDRGVSKAPMAPSITKGRGAASAPTAAPAAAPGTAPDAGGAPAPASAPMAELMRQLRELRRHVEANADYVGERFAEEARRIHYGEVESRAIYGEASPQEAEELREEGVAVSRIPWVPGHDA